MTPYLLLAGAVALLAVLGQWVAGRLAAQSRVPYGENSSGRARWTYFDFIACAVLVGFSGLRYRVGTDYPIYALVYESLRLSDWRREFDEASQEVGFVTIMLVTKAVTDSPQAIFWVVAALTIIPVYSTIKRCSLNPGMSIAMYVALAYAPSFNAMRQYMAGALLLLAWSYLESDKRRFYVISVLAVSIHLTSIVAVLIVLVAQRWRPDPRTIGLIFAGAVLVAAIVDQVPALANFLASVNPRYASYLYSGDTGIGAYLQIGAYLALLIFAIVVGRRRAPLSKIDTRLAVYVLIGIALMVVGTQAVVLFRLGSYLTIFTILLVPNRLAVTRDRALAGMMLSIAIATYFVLHLSNYGDVIPYQTYLGT